MKNKYVHDSVVHNTTAAEKIVPFLIETLNVSSVVDVGCGTGTWLKVFADHSTEILGVEGFHLDLKKLLIPAGNVLLHDLEKPLSIDRKFDLAISLEVAEHLNIAGAEQFVKGLTELSGIVLFSAAIPFQGGQNHINEQWQSYWVILFSKFGYVPIDIIRPRFWDDPEIEFWYRQNTMLFVAGQSDRTHRLQQLKSFHAMNIIHPDAYLKKASYLDSILAGNQGVVSSFKIFIKTVRRLVR